MKKSRLFIENIFIYGFGGIISKIIPVIMVPIITRMMPNTEYYGLSDLSNTLISIAAVVAILGMYDGLFRMFFEKDDFEYQVKTCSTALFFSLSTSFVVAIIMLLFRTVIAKSFFESEKYTYLVIIAAFTIMFGATNQIVAAPTRMQNKRAIYLIINCLSPVVSYSIAIILLLKKYYTTALPIAALITGIAIELVYLVINRKWFKLSSFDKESLKKMLFIGLPLVPNFLIYWIFNSCDKIMITNSLGVGFAGVYSIGSKLGHCSQLIYTAFAGGWSYFVFSTMKDDNQIQYNSKLFEVLAAISFTTSALICVVAKPLYIILFPGEYLEGFVVAPYLFLCPLLLMLFQIAASQFTVIKKTWYNTIVLFLGSVINIILNYILIPLVGIEGAAIATLCGYIVSLCICLIILKKKELFNVTSRMIFSITYMIIYILMWRFVTIESLVLSLGIFILFINLFAFQYRREFAVFLSKIKTKMKRENQ